MGEYRHTHWDHSGGNEELKAKYPHIRVYGSKIDEVRKISNK